MNILLQQKKKPIWKKFKNEYRGERYYHSIQLYKKDNTSAPSGIYPKNTRLVQHSKINKYNSTYRQFISIECEMVFDKTQ